MYKIGRFVFVNQEYYERLLKLGIIKPHDISPTAREKHEEEAEFKDGKRIKATAEERWLYTKNQLRNETVSKLKSVKPGEPIVNPWIV